MATKKKTKSKKKLKLEDLPGQDDPKSPLDGALLLRSAAPVLKALETDLLERARSSTSVTKALKARHAEERARQRTADDFEQWQRSFVTQVSAAWFLSCVFVRTLEDRGLSGQARIAGPGASDSQTLFFELAPHLTERDYLLSVFRELCHFDAAKDLFDEGSNPVWLLTPSAEAAKGLLRLFRTPTAENPAFRFGQADTRFLGDLYQDLSEDVRKKYALLQTPRFVESFILDQTLEPAIEKFGLDETTLIDPTCGSGHFLLGAFERLFDRRLKEAPNLDVRTAAEKALDAVYGADINPYAVAIARFRLTLAFFEKAGFERLKDAPKLPLHLVVADSLLHNPHHDQGEFQNLEGVSAREWGGDLYALEDEAAARDVLHRRYAAVVGNPPYITVKDAVLRDRYRAMYDSAFRTYSLAVPFTERMFQLGRDGACVGMITANSFMKREFGKKVIEEYLPTVNLTAICNTSGAYIPGHGTPTVLLFGTSEPPKGDSVHAILASRGEPTTPSDPEQGQVWRSIVDHYNDVGFENDYVSVAEVERSGLAQHPWSLSGGGASELKALLEERSERTLGDLVDAIGRSTHTGEDGVFFMPAEAAERLGIRPYGYVPLVKGEQVRDWAIADDEVCLFPYDADAAPRPPEDGPEHHYYWRYRTILKDRQDYGQKIEERGLNWFEHSMFFPERFRRPLGISFAFVATHNHFVLDRGGKVFNRSAPIIKLPETATEDDHLALLAYLNSSTACFWMKQVFMNKGGSGIGRGIQDEAWEARYEFDGTKLQMACLPAELPRLSNLSRQMERLVEKLEERSAVRVLEAWLTGEAFHTATVETLTREIRSLRARQAMLQERLDWMTYELFGLLSPEDRAILEQFEEWPPDAELPPGSRPFEFVLHEKAGNRTQWFERNGYTRPSPSNGSDNLSSTVRAWVEARIKVIKRNKNIRIIEQPEYKHRWSSIDIQADLCSAARELVLDAAEKSFGPEPLSSRAIHDRLTQWGEKLTELLRLSNASLPELLEAQSVPFSSARTYSRGGFEKHEAWEHSWRAQRDEDAGGKAPASVPPKYGKGDFASDTYWSLRGKLDVPKERFISYPGCESDEDGEPIYGWAGWNHLQRAQALAALYQHRKNEEGWEKERLTPLLAGLLELVPWVKQWHNEPSEEFGGLKLGEYFEGFVDSECQALGLTREDLERWRPPSAGPRRQRKEARLRNKTADGKVVGHTA